MPINFGTTFEPFKGQSKAQRLSDGRVIKATRAGNQGTPAKDTGALYPYMPKGLRKKRGPLLICIKVILSMKIIEVTMFH